MTTGPANRTLDALRASWKEVERLRQQNQALLQTASEPIAIVGLSLRLPGGVDDMASLWRLLEAGRDAVDRVPSARWDADELYDPDPDVAGKTYVRAGAFLEDVSGFDAEFFGISPREALFLDPQQRLLLEAAWQALEDAQIVPRTLRESRTGVYVASGLGEYQQRALSSLDPHAIAGTQPSFVAGRLSYVLGLQGPTLAVDTACSSSLVALHLACQALRRGECKLALVGGAQLMLSPSTFVLLSKTRALASDGRSKAFSQNADGYGRGEGVVVLVLERLRTAREGGRRIRGLVRGSAVNHDGPSSGITVPNGRAQQSVLRAALEDARLRGADVDFVECHGTGTVLGDPIELHALGAVYGDGRDRDHPIRLGTIKTNIGHLEHVAGLAGVVKVLAAFENDALPPALHTTPRNSHVAWSSLPMRVVDRLEPWLREAEARRAGISAFGLSGTNAHVILEEAPHEASPPAATEARGPWQFVVTAKSEAALREQAARLCTHLETHAELSLVDVAHSLVTTRAAFEWRAVVVASDRDVLSSQLRAVSEGEPGPLLVTGNARGSGKLVFVFPGQGSQWLGMARELRASSEPFAQQLRACAEALAPFVDWSLFEVLDSQDETLLERVDVIQPVLFAVMVSLATWWRSQGVEPDAVVGHSQGEIAAAYVAGALSLSDAARVAALRARALRQLSGRGGMASVELSAAELREHLARYGDALSIAAINSPTSTVVSGAAHALDAFLVELGKRDVLGRRIRVDYASHCAQLEEIEDELLQALAPIAPRPAPIALYSTLRAELVDGSALDARYWYDNGRNTVRFADAVRGLLASGHRYFVEVSAHPVLTQAVQRTAEAANETATVVGTLRRDQGGLQRLLLSLGELYANGRDVDWSRVLPGGRAVELPTYAFQRRRYWLEAGLQAEVGEPTGHPLLGSRVSLAEGDSAVFVARWSRTQPRWLGEHEELGQVALPLSAWVELALAAGERVGMPVVDELSVETRLVLPAGGSLEVQLSVEAEAEAMRRFAVHARTGGPDGSWERQVTGRLKGASGGLAKGFSAWPPPGSEAVSVEELYEQAESVGWKYGTSLRSLKRVWRAGGDVYAEVELAEEQSGEAGGYAVHPALLEGALQLLHAEGVWARQWRGVELEQSGAKGLRVRLSGNSGAERGLDLYDESGSAIGRVAGLQTTDLKALRSPTSAGVYAVQWRALPELDSGAGDWSLLSASGDWGARACASVSSFASGTSKTLVYALREPVGSDGPAAQAETTQVLSVLQAWVQERGLEDKRLVVATRGAVCAGAGEGVEDLSRAAVWGLVRSAQSEHPELFGLLDVEEWSEAQLEVGLSHQEREPQVAVRGMRAKAPRLVAARLRRPERREKLSSEGAALITGGTGVLGRELARHLVREYGLQHVVLCSRRGGGAELKSELQAQGATTVRVEALDVSDARAVRELVESITRERPLQWVIHTAAVLEDEVLMAQSERSVERVFAGKVCGAHALHEATQELALSRFVMFSSISAVIGSAGQSNYAAANAYLDALVQQRRSRGLAGQSLAWGLWAEKSGLTGKLSDADRARMERAGMRALSLEEGLSLFDACWAEDEAVCVPAKLDRAVLRAHREALPTVLQELVGGRARRPVRVILQGESEAEVRARVAERVRGAAAAVLGMPTPQLEGDRPLKELGLDSLMAVELRNRLSVSLGLKLPTTLLFDYPTLDALTSWLVGELWGARPSSRALTSGGASEEAIAIVGMSCRLPGGISTPQGLWQLLESEQDAIESVPSDRGWSEQASDVEFSGGFLRELANFDAGFFGISPREALALDPQQRLLLEASWEALERAGLDGTQLSGSATGVYVGLGGSDYLMRLREVPSEVSGYLATGSAGSVASGRISYALGLQGPALTVNTACSSSLVALHLACQALRRGECTLALAGGATVMSSPMGFLEFQRQGALSADGRCKAFSGRADGTGWSEGVGVLVLERVSDAQRYGHRILALIRGSALNQDGRSQGLTAPNGPAQEQVIRQALANAGLNGSDVDAVEGHGTGTRLGDPIEAQALLATYGQGREGALHLGSIKSNIGHTQAAAGVAGVMKMVLALQHEVLPRSLYAEDPSGEVDWSSGSVKLLDRPVAWPRGERRRRAGVSAFGISGTNAHVILEEAPEESGAVVVAGAEPSPLGATQAGGPWQFVVTAKSEAGLREQAGRLRAHVEARPEARLVDVAHSLVATRAAFEERAVVVASDRAELLAGLEAVSERRVDARVATSCAAGGKLAVLFTGQGSQRRGMGAELYGRSAVFRTALDAVFGAFEGKLPEPLSRVMFEGAGEDALEATLYAQPALFALEVGLYRVLESCGVEPSYVLGHSLGEWVAAHVSGVVTLEDAATLVSSRAQLMQELASGGGMLSVEASEAELSEALERWEGALELGAVNGPRASVVSGELTALASAEAWFAQRGWRTTRLQVSHAFHSKRMEPMLEAFEAVAGRVSYQTPQLGLVSNVTGALAGEEVCRASYWVKQIRSPVRFGAGLQTLSEQGVTTYVELGPQGVLSALGQGSVKGRFWSVLRSGRREAESFAVALGGVYASGQRVDWSRVLPGGRAVELPTYAFQRTRYWLEAGLQAEVGEPTGHPLLGGRLSLAEGDCAVFVARWSRTQPAWLAEHQVFDHVILPATAFMDMALSAGALLGTPAIDELTLEAPLALPEADFVEIQLTLGERDEDGRRSFSVHSRVAGRPAAWTRHVRGTLSDAPHASSPSALEWPPRGAVRLSLDDLYEQAETHGLKYGPRFQCLKEVWRRESELFAEVELPEQSASEANDYLVHPALLDSVTHALFLAQSGTEGDSGALGLLSTCSGVWVAATGANRMRAQLTLTQTEGTVGMVLYDVAGAPIGGAGALRTRPASSEHLQHSPAAGERLYGLQWRRIPAGVSAPARWSLLGPHPAWAGAAAEWHPDVARLAESIREGTTDVEMAVFVCDGTDQDAATACASVLGIAQAWLKETALEGRRLVVLTSRSVSTQAADEIENLANAAVCGLVRAAQNEHPGAFALLDLDEWTRPNLEHGLRHLNDETQIAIRAGRALAARVVMAPPALVLPHNEAWILRAPPRGGPWRSSLQPHAESQRPLREGEVRIGVQAASASFEDRRASVAMAGAGVVLEVGPDVTTFAPGDRVMGLIPQALAALAIADQRTLARIPGDLGFAEAAGMLASGGQCVDLADPMTASPERLADILREIVASFERAALRSPPIACWDIRQSDEAYRYLAESDEARQVVLTIPQPLNRNATALITGGTGMLGSHVARHLVTKRGVRHLVLCSRSGAGELLKTELEALGATVRVEAVDVSDQAAVTALVHSIPGEYPLRLVVHAAGVLEDGVLASQSEAGLTRVFAPKVLGAQALHEATQALPLSGFVMCSSIAGILGSAGQSNYAAANSYLDALAQQRRARGLPGQSLAWGYWAEQSRLTEDLREVDLARMARSGVAPLSFEEGLLLFDACLARSEALLIPVKLDRAVLKAHADALPSLLRELTGHGRRQSSAAAESLREQLARSSAKDARALLLERVASMAANVLGMPQAQRYAERPLRELGLDSLMAVELRNRLAAATGLKLPATLLFDHPTIAALVKLVYEKLIPSEPRPERVEDELAIRKLLATIPVERLRKAHLLDLLLQLAAPTDDAAAEVETQTEDIDALAVTDLIDLAMQLDESPSNGVE